MGKNNNEAPPAPNYQPIADASAAAAAEANALAKQQFEWAKQTYAENKGVTDRVVEQYLQTGAENAKNAAADRKRYEEIFQPLENDLAREAQEYASPERKQLEIGRAQADVAQKFDAARKNAQRDLESFGINPGATRFAAIDIGTRAQQAAAQAAAGSQASERVDATGRALRSEAINVGRGYPGQIAGTYGTANQAGSGAVNSELATTASGSSTMGSPIQWSGVGSTNLGNWTNALKSGYADSLAQFKADQSSSSGIGSLLGLGFSAATSAIPGSSIAGRLFAEDGGAIPGPGAPEGATPGGAIPERASPTRGRVTDDVPAQLTVGEFVIPVDVARWKGEEFFQKTIKQSREAKAGAMAKPTRGPAPTNMPPAFISRPQGAPGAIPMR